MRPTRQGSLISDYNHRVMAMKHVHMINQLAFICLILAGCSSTPSIVSPSDTNDFKDTNLATSNGIRNKLLTQHREWKGAPYRYGGLNKRGVDCSGFVHLTYLNKFGITIPRTTIQQSRTGREISQKQLVAGDLVFFRTGLAKQHVGIYMGKRKFLHASTSRGVTISNMDNVYWRDKYWKSQRI